MEHKDSTAFMNIAGTVVAPARGTTTMISERQGTVLKIFDVSLVGEALYVFAQTYRKQQIYPDKKRLLVKEYPETAAALLERVGFYKDMPDYMLYR